ncbi:uncharacterized protein LOC133846170 isoform X2 [Drosophila sulfurigaster albostrigata]|uniref:uncharacterized protein LOC133846170 isoform X2 n=1 Tax=Drosophila sulfurigaster albostrigata TaxID=89887 RepID=UPI002D2196B2|nr:uncharacterized protein LOC133846170 isoform X2 [Drosophila sulfurigaster albostrigata]
MLRALVSVSQRAKAPQAMLLMKGMDPGLLAQIKQRQSNVLARQLVRSFASGNDSIKGAATGVPQGGIIGSIGGNATTMGHAAGDATACGQVQTATFGNAGSGNSDGCKSNEECGNIGTVESTAAAAPKKTKKAKATASYSKEPTTDRSASGGNMADDAVKQLQEVAANLPSKAQVEKFVFRVLAFVYDITYLTGTWTIRFVDEKILRNATVQYYWKRFHEKMEQAKKD